MLPARQGGGHVLLPSGSALLEALPGKESAVAEFLKEAKVLVGDEPGTLVWFAFQRGPTSFGIFDVLGSAADRDTHLHGEVRTALQASGPAMLSAPPVIAPVDIVAAKLPIGGYSVRGRANDPVPPSR
jgi:hypothetical protein